MHFFSCSPFGRLIKSFKVWLTQVHKSKYWEYVYEDSMDLIAKLPVVAAAIYRNIYKDGSGSGFGIGAIDKSKDGSANFTHMHGFDDEIFVLVCYLTKSVLKTKKFLVKKLISKKSYLRKLCYVDLFFKQYF